LIDVDVGINHNKISKYPEKQNLSKFLKKSLKSDISQLLLFLSNIISLRKVKGKKPGFILKTNIQCCFKNEIEFSSL